MTLDEQKVEFARRYYRNPNDVVMIVASILGSDVVESNPFEAINASREWPQDPIVLEELERLRSETKPKGEYVNMALRAFRDCMDLGETKSAAEFLKLAMTAEGHLKPTDVKGKSGADKLHELAAMIVETDNQG